MKLLKGKNHSPKFWNAAVQERRISGSPKFAFQIMKSTIPLAGRGLFTTRALAKGARLPVPGILVKRNSLEDLCTRFADAYKFRVGAHLLIPVGIGGMINHSPTPNVKKVVRGRTLHLRALRAIQAGEELFFAYSRYARNRFYINRKKLS